MKTFIQNTAILLAVLISAMPVMSQNQLSGVVMEQSNNSPLPYATVTLLKSDSTYVTGTMSSNDGTFKLSPLSHGDYLLCVSFMGLGNESLAVNVPATSNVGNIYLKEEATALAEVVVTGQRPLLVQRTDRYVVNVSGNITTGGKNAREILGQTPGVLALDSDIKAMGKSAAIHIDGRPSRISGEQLEALLASMSGDEIDQIEIITNPSSRYDAEGGAIINIKTKKGLQYGLNGTADIGYRQGRKDRENAGINLNMREGKFNLYGSYSVIRSNLWEKFIQEKRMPVDGTWLEFDQQTLTTNNEASYNHNYKLGVDYFINLKHTIGFIFNGSDSPTEDNISDAGSTTINPVLNGIQRSESENVRSQGYHNKQYNLNYQGQFSQPGQLLNIDVDYANFSSRNGQSVSNLYFGENGQQTGEREQTRNHNPSDIKVWSAKVDYSQPIGKGMLEAGAKISQSDTDNNLLYERYNGSAWVNDPGQTNHFVYTEQISAAYINYKHTLGRLELQAGLRGEHTKSEGDQKTTQEFNDTTYFQLFPTAYAVYRISDTQTVQLGYRRSVSRPAYRHLNPFEYSLDAFSYVKGNPYLKPSISDDITLTYSNYKHGLTAMLSYAERRDQIVENPVQDTENGRYGMSRTNFGKIKTVTGMVNYYKAINKWWMMNGMAMGVYIKNQNTDEIGAINTDALAVNLQLYNRFVLSPTLSAEVTGLLSTGGYEGYMKLKSFGFVNLGLMKTFMNNKLSVAVNVNDIFNSMKVKASVNTSEQQYNLNVARDNRWAGISVRYTFGSDKVKQARNRRSGMEEEAGRAGK